MGMVRIERALISVSAKRGVEELAKALGRHGVEVLSTGGTARMLREAGCKVTEVADYTGAPEILDGRVKTLHPKIHGGLLGRPTEDHRAQMSAHGIPNIDLVVVNLYPFRETVARQDTTLEVAIENIDIGGPSMIRSAAKNHERVTVVVDPDDYPEIIAELDANGGAISDKTRRELARRAFAYTASYDGAIANFLSALPEEPGEGPVQAGPFPQTLTLQLHDGKVLRYGENPHQQAAFYVEEGIPTGPSVARADVLQGKELSYNNIVDLDAALQLACEFSRPAVAIIKHTNPSGVAESDGGVAAAYRLARECDPVSAFGGIVAANRVVDDELGALLAETFLECVIAPGFTDGAREALGKKKNLRLLAFPTSQRGKPAFTFRSVHGGVLVQTKDEGLVSAMDAEVVTKRKPTADELRALDFAWRVCKHVKSNAIVFAGLHDGGARTLGIGAGQMSRVDSVKLARDKAQAASRGTASPFGRDEGQLPLDGSVLASDAFFPFPDGLELAAQAGARAVIQPGGSVKDADVIAAADAHDVAMVFTKMRHFRH